nr:hypothetical protein [Pandoravirus aubagnensis]
MQPQISYVCSPTDSRARGSTGPSGPSSIRARPFYIVWAVLPFFVSIGDFHERARLRQTDRPTGGGEIMSGSWPTHRKTPGATKKRRTRKCDDGANEQQKDVTEKNELTTSLFPLNIFIIFHLLFLFFLDKQKEESGERKAPCESSHGMREHTQRTQGLQPPDLSREAKESHKNVYALLFLHAKEL